MKREHVIYDSAWKEILEAFFQDFIQFFISEIYDKIDWKHGYEFLDKEFQILYFDSSIS